MKRAQPDLDSSPALCEAGRDGVRGGCRFHRRQGCRISGYKSSEPKGLRLECSFPSM
jgi:hypothetical protein